MVPLTCTNPSNWVEFFNGVFDSSFSLPPTQKFEPSVVFMLCTIKVEAS